MIKSHYCVFVSIAFHYTVSENINTKYLISDELIIMGSFFTEIKTYFLILLRIVVIQSLDSQASVTSLQR